DRPLGADPRLRPNAFSEALGLGGQIEILVSYVPETAPHDEERIVVSRRHDPEADDRQVEYAQGVDILIDLAGAFCPAHRVGAVTGSREADSLELAGRDPWLDREPGDKKDVAREAAAFYLLAQGKELLLVGLGPNASFQPCVGAQVDPQPDRELRLRPQV